MSRRRPRSLLRSSRAWARSGWRATAKAGHASSWRSPSAAICKSAHELNEIVAHVFDEPSVYRIDHYLGKETVQNIIMFRFGNSMFEPVWNRNYIEYIEITAAEKLGVENRGAFYEETGALRDMVANHMLQLLMLTAMEPPVNFDADSVRGHKVEVLTRHSSHVEGGGREAHGSRAVRAGTDRRQARSGLSPGARRQSQFAH